MADRFEGFSRRMTRRTLLGLGVSTLAALGGIRATQQRAEAGDVGTLDVCYWETRAVECSDGRKLEYRCEVCCAGGVCETVQCGWFDAGPC